MSEISFVKYEGLGNDFLVVETDDPELFSKEEITAICDRRRGIGGDGVLLVLPGAHDGQAGKMRVLNADGSVPEMCGNGIRCVALHVAKAGDTSLVFDTDAGERSCAVERTADGAEVSVSMGTARLVGRRALSLPGLGEFVLEDVNMGNPHALLVDIGGKLVGSSFDERKFVGEKRGAMAEIGKGIETQTKGGTNVEFASIRADGSIDLVVWERGVGFTLACGTGACATAAYACAKGLLPYGPVAVHLPGGDLRVTVDQGGGVVMRGPARRVFAGSFFHRV